ncbi:UPF0149 family protein [Dyella sp.]|jgi:uncharacterized protein YgfB (UPF0149 family)|uniref:UPF0149 family protein n=1 Tax=Dyella sp. TaxID=1869338 RepID=UPI002D76B1E2|nr:UPF0149 family protein [Dyella sp.]HET6431181.1 UPF0149 family protein [Dyella sp.]
MTARTHVEFDDLDDLIHRLKLGTSASELHGSLCGYLAGGGRVGRQPLLSLLHLDGEAPAPAPADAALLERLSVQAGSQLADPDLGFEPMLPADDRPLAERAEATVEWCRGFLGGFGLAGTDAHANLSEEAREILRDLGTIAATSLDLGNEADDEDALIELHEFVRVGAMLLQTECAGDPAAGNDTVH